MVNLHSLPIDNIKQFKKSNSVANFHHQELMIATPQREALQVQREQKSPQTGLVRLALEELKCFEVVDHQFSHWGLTLTNTIAIQPSNPVFATESGVTVLMGAPKGGLIEIKFQQPIQFFEGRVTSSRRTALSAYDQEDHLLDQVELSAPNLAGSQSSLPPNMPLSVQGHNIDKITFYAFDGQLIVDDIRFEF